MTERASGEPAAGGRGYPTQRIAQVVCADLAAAVLLASKGDVTIQVSHSDSDRFVTNELMVPAEARAGRSSASPAPPGSPASAPSRRQPPLPPVA